MKVFKDQFIFLRHRELNETAATVWKQITITKHPSIVGWWRKLFYHARGLCWESSSKRLISTNCTTGFKKGSRRRYVKTPEKLSFVERGEDENSLRLEIFPTAENGKLSSYFRSSLASRSIVYLFRDMLRPKRPSELSRDRAHASIAQTTLTEFSPSRACLTVAFVKVKISSSTLCQSQ